MATEITPSRLAVPVFNIARWKWHSTARTDSVSRSATARGRRLL